MAPPAEAQPLVNRAPPVQWDLLDRKDRRETRASLVQRVPPALREQPVQMELRGLRVLPVRPGRKDLRAHKESRACLVLRDRPAIS